jgi:hypothetical protein
MINIKIKPTSPEYAIALSKLTLINHNIRTMVIKKHKIS